MTKRVAIVGTAGSWRQTPWTDPGLEIWSLNDAWQIDGFQRADAWYDLHPVDHFHLVPQPKIGDPKPTIYAHQVPFGYYVRPESHRDWLATQTIPVWLHPDHATQWPESATWPSARAFPRAEIEAQYGRYFTSTPAWMIGHALQQGVQELHIYGIHLSTESEYIDQRPNFEYLIGMMLGRGKRRLTIKDGLRYYETADGMVVLPESSPILSSKFQYAFEPSPRRKVDPLKWDAHKAQIKRERTIAALKTTKPYWPWTVLEEPQDDGSVNKRRVSLSTLQAELAYYDALLHDAQEQVQRAQMGAM